MVVQSPKCVQESSISNGEVSLRTDSEFQKRVSPRLKEKQRVEKELLVRRRVELLDDNEEVVASAVAGGGSDEKSSEKKKKTYKRRCIGGNVNQEEEKNKVNGEVAKTAEDSEAGNGVVKGVVAEKSDIAKVKETIRLFNKYYLLLVQVCYYFCPLSLSLSLFWVFVFLILSFVCLNAYLFFWIGCVGRGKEVQKSRSR